MPAASRAMPIVLAAVLIDTIGFGIVMPVFPTLLQQLGHIDLEAATRVAGYMLVAFALAQFVAGPVLGNLSDRYGRRPVLIASMLAFGVDYALMAIAPSLAWLFLGRTVAGIAGAVYGPASSVIADVTPPERRSAAFGYISAAFGIGFVIGPAIGGLLAGFGPRTPFIAAALLALGNAAVMALAMPETHARENRRAFHWRDAHVVGAFKPLFAIRIAAPLLVACFVYQLAHMVYPATWAFWATIRFDWSPSAIGWSLAYIGLVMAVVQAAVVGPVIARIGDRRALVIGLAADALGFFLFAFIAAGVAGLCDHAGRGAVGVRRPCGQRAVVADGRPRPARRVAGRDGQPRQHRHHHQPVADDAGARRGSRSRLRRRGLPARRRAVLCRPRHRRVEGAGPCRPCAGRDCGGVTASPSPERHKRSARG